MTSSTIRTGCLHRRVRATVLRAVLVLTSTAAVYGATGVLDASAATLDAAGYTPTLYVYQNNELIDVKTFKIADLQECRHRASALLQLYLNHSDIEDDMRLIVRCVPVPPPSAGHRKGEHSPDGERHERVAEAEVSL